MVRGAYGLPARPCDAIAAAPRAAIADGRRTPRGGTRDRPSSSRVDWATALLESRYPSTDVDVPEPACTATDGPITVEDEVEGSELGGIRHRCLAEWLGIVGARNHDLAADLSQWSLRSESPDRDLPARLAHRLEPYTPLLLAMLGDAE